MAKKRLCFDFVYYNDGKFVEILMTNVIEADCLRIIKQEKSLELNGSFLKPESPLDPEFQENKMHNSLECRKAANQCQAKITVAFYMQLLVNLFSKDPTSRVVRVFITKLFGNKDF